MSKGRLEAFTDGVVAIVITLLVFNLHAPNSAGIYSLVRLAPSLFVYIATFLFMAVIWYSHHQMFQLATKINTRVIWADIFWLFWLTLAPFTAQWVGKFPQSFWPEMVYGIVSIMWSVSFAWIRRELVNVTDQSERVAKAIEHDHRSRWSLELDLAFLLTIFVWPPLFLIGRLLVSFLWMRPNNPVDWHIRNSH